MKTILFVFALSVSSQVLAWGDMGHSSIGYIAEKNLTPEGKKFIYTLMGPEPLALSAIFPDQVRGDSRFSGFGPYHYIEIPAGSNFKNLPLENFVAKSANTIIEDAPILILQNKGKTRLSIPEKQMMMRYLVHIIGDVHQPLHVGNGLDRGGNYCEIKTPTGSKKNLHSFWDSGIIDSMEKEVLEARKVSYFTYTDFSEWLLSESEKNGLLAEVKEQISKTSKVDWYSESQALHAEVYPDEVPGTLPQDREYCKIIDKETGVASGPKSKNSPQILPDYMVRAKGIVKKRILLAGLRLANEINEMALKRGDKAMSEETAAKLFLRLMPESKAPRGPSSKSKSKAKVAPPVNEHHCGDEH